MLQGFLSLLCVPVVPLGVGPLAEGLVDVHAPLRGGQALLVPGEEAKPFGGKGDRNESRPLAAGGLCFVSSARDTRHTGANPVGKKSRGRSEGSRKQQGHPHGIQSQASEAPEQGMQCGMCEFLPAWPPGSLWGPGHTESYGDKSRFCSSVPGWNPGPCSC